MLYLFSYYVIVKSEYSLRISRYWFDVGDIDTAVRNICVQVSYIRFVYGLSNGQPHGDSQPKQGSNANTLQMIDNHDLNTSCIFQYSLLSFEIFYETLLLGLEYL